MHALPTNKENKEIKARPPASQHFSTSQPIHLLYPAATSDQPIKKDI
jgi:hypothetical protein